jgi:D-cysteine desulfhydrase
MLYYVAKLITTYASKFLTGRRPYLIPLLGSSPISVLSYLDAALELKDQIEKGSCPRPDFIFITVGTGGTAAGLMLGEMVFRGIGEVIGVRVLERVFVNEQIMAWEINRTRRFLKRRDVDLNVEGVRAGDVRLIHDFVGKGYAEATFPGEKAINLVKDKEGIDLDVTYTGKTMAAMLHFIERNKGGRFLFWHTLNTVDLTPYTDRMPNLSEVNRDFLAYLMIDG